MSESNLPFISVILPTHNRKEMLRRALEAMANQSYPEDLYEVVVVDDGSTDGTADFLAEFSLPHLHLRYLTGEQKGPAAARNLGVWQARGEVILFTGDDCIPDADLLLKHGRRHQAEKDIAVLGYVDWHPEANLNPLMHLLAHHGQTAYPMMENPDRVGPQFFYTSNVSAKKEHLVQAGGFDEDFKWAALEDTELGMRLARLGVRLVLERAAITYHHHEHTWQSIAGRQRALGRAAAVFIRKDPELREELGIDDLADPEFFERFARALLHFWYLQGIAQEMGAAAASPAPADSELQLDFSSWLNTTTVRFMTRLLGRTRTAEEQVRLLRRLEESKERLIRQQEAKLRQQEGRLRQQEGRVRQLDERIRSLKERIREHEEHIGRLRTEIEGLEAFARKVRSSLPYKIARGLKRILRPSGPQT